MSNLITSRFDSRVGLAQGSWWRRGAPWLALGLGLLPGAASASFLSGEAADTAATYIAWFSVTVVPIGLIFLFWKLHVLPERIAEARHHPQKEAIHVLCLLSLVVGGLLWPLAWLWAYTKPVGHRLAYGTERHEDYFHQTGEKWRAGGLSDDEAVELREELDAMAQRMPLPTGLKALRKDRAAAPVAPGAAEGSA